MSIHPSIHPFIRPSSSYIIYTLQDCCEQGKRHFSLCARERSVRARVDAQQARTAALLPEVLPKAEANLRRCLRKFSFGLSHMSLCNQRLYNALTN